MNTIKPAIIELERIFTELAPLFGRDLPLPVITIQSKGRRNALGWHWKDKWQNGTPGKLTEINISAEHLDRPAEDIAETMLHEMVHYAKTWTASRTAPPSSTTTSISRRAATRSGWCARRTGGAG